MGKTLVLFDVDGTLTVPRKVRCCQVCVLEALQLYRFDKHRLTIATV